MRTCRFYRGITVIARPGLSPKLGTLTALAVMAFQAVILGQRGDPESAATCWNCRTESTEDSALTNRTAGMNDTQKVVGAQACAYCHGQSNSGSQPKALREYTIWAEQDPHAFAYSTLFNDRSRKIVQRLGLDQANRAPECLVCHTTNNSHQTSEIAFARDKTDGVSCEACHGSAEKWLEPHTQQDWKFLSTGDKQALGFRDTDNLVNRAVVCAHCHVGSANGQVNHDMIAAGHPRLYFELSAYLDRMPRHWSREQDNSLHSPAPEARTWAVGQFVSAAAAAELLSARAVIGPKQPRHQPLVEFAEYECFSCHRPIQSKAIGDANISGNRSDGKLVWGTWHFSLIHELLDGPNHTVLVSNPAEAKLIANQIKAIQQTMSQSVPDWKVVRVAAASLREQLMTAATIASASSITESELRQTIVGLSSLTEAAGDQSWDTMAQRYLGLVAIHQSMMEFGSGIEYDRPRQEEAAKQLATIKSWLKFPENRDGPLVMPLGDSQEINRLFLQFGRKVAD